MAKKGEIVGVVDFGSREIRVLIARKDDDGTIQIIGHGTEPARACISQGVIQDLNATQVALKKALALAEKEAQVPLKSIFCGIGGKNIDTFIREGNIKLEKQIVETDQLNEALTIASHDILAPGKRVTSSVTAQEWYVDDLRVMDPIGMSGYVLKTRVHFALVPAVILDNLATCVNSQNLQLEDFIFAPLACAQGCLTPEEMELGVAVLDMGRSMTGLAVYRDYRILGTQCFEWGGYHLTRDVAAGLHISFEEADELIMSYGIANELLENEGQEETQADFRPGSSPLPGASRGSGGLAPGRGELPGHWSSSRMRHEDSGTPIKLKTNVPGAPAIVGRKDVEGIIHERSRELMTKVRQYLQARGLMKNLVCGLVFTGGASEIKNHVELAKSVLQVSARKGAPNKVEILPHAVAAPAWSTAVGVVRHAFEFRAAVQSGRIDTDGPGIPAWRKVWKGLNKYFF